MTDPRERKARARSCAVALGLVVCGGLAPHASAQTLPVGDWRQEYLRVLQLTGRVDVGSLTVRPIGMREAGEALGTGTHPWAPHFQLAPAPDRTRPRVSPTDATLRIFSNTSFPTGQDDGAVWQGKGITTALDAGASVVWRGLTVIAHPTLIFTQNASFELAPVTLTNMPEYAYPWRRMDFPQRFGPDAFWTLDPGQSEVSLRGFGVAAAFGTANLWWGPSLRNAIVMSNNAPGFLHASVGTDDPVGIGIGELEVQWIWGDLDASEWFDPTLADKDRFLTGIVASYSPSFLEGLSLGLTRLFYAWKPDAGVPFRDYLLVFQGVRKKTFATPTNPGGNDEHDQMVSLFGRWVIPGGGVEVYGEWARNDHPWDLRDFALQPAHSRAFTLGLQKAFELPDDRLMALTLEVTDLEKSYHLRPTPTYYAHHIVSQGYTQRGQIIGAGVGPGGNSQHLGADLYTGWGRAGVYLQRDVRDNDAYRIWGPITPVVGYQHDVLLHLGTSASVFRGPLLVGGGLVLTREYNRFFAGRDLWNLNVSLSASWRPS